MRDVGRGQPGGGGEGPDSGLIETVAIRLLDQVPAAVVATDLSGTVLYWNRHAEALYGWSAEEALGRNIVDLVVPVPHLDAASEIMRRLLTGETWEGEFPAQRKDGSTFLAYVVDTAIRDEAGSLVGIAGVSVDITQSRRLEEEVRQRMEVLHALYGLSESVGRAESPEEIHEAALDALQSTLRADRASVLLFDPDGVMRFKAWRGLSEAYRARTEGHSPWPADATDPQPVLVPDVMEEPSLEGLLDTIVSEGIHALAFIPLVSGGRLLGVFMIYFDTPHRFSDEEIQLSRAIAAHIAFAIQRRRAEDELRRSRDELSVILQGVADGITVQDRTGRLVYANNAAARASGFPNAQAFLEAPVQEILARFDIMDEAGRLFPVDQLPGRLALRGEHTEGAVMRFRIRATGEERWSVVSATPVLDERGDVQLAVNIFHDITKRRRAEEAQRFLSEAGEVLASSLDYETTLESVARLAVPALADWCIVDMLEDGESIRQLAVAHADPEKADLARELRRRYPPTPDRGHPIVRVLETGQPDLDPEITDRDLRTRAVDEGNLRMLQELGTRSHMVVPLVARGRTLGAISFVSGVPGRYGEPELRLAESLAARAALAVDNARLYREAQEAIRRTGESLALLDAQKEASVDGILVVSTEGQMLSFNRRFVEMWEIPDEVVASRSDEAALRSVRDKLVDPDEFLARVAYLYEHPEEESRDEIRLVHGRTIDRYSAPVRGPEGTLYGRVWFFRDITEEREATQRLRGRERQQAAVARLGARALSGLGTEELMREAVRLVTDTLSVDYCEVLELVPGGGELVLRAGAGWEEDLLGSSVKAVGSRSQAGFTLLSKGPVIVHDLPTEQRFTPSPLLLERGVTSGMSVVIEGSDGPFGVMGAHTTSARSFTRDDTNFLQAIANVVATSIQRRRQELALRESERNLRLIADNAAEVVFAYDMDRRLVYVNAAVEPQTGYTVDEIREQNFINWLHPDDEARGLALWQAAFEGKSFSDQELRVVRKDGEIRWVLSSLGPLLDEEGRQIGVQGRDHDITHRKSTERRISIQHAVARTLAEAHTISEAAPTILQALCEGLEWEIGLIWLADEDDMVVRCLDVRVSAPESVPVFEAVSRETTLQPGEDLPGRVWRDARPAFVTDAAAELSPRRADAAAREGLRGGAAFPIVLGAEVLGVIEFFSRTVRAADQDVLDMMASIGSQIGQFIERREAEEAERTARREAEAAQERLAFLAEATVILAASLDYRKTLNQVARLAVPMLADWCAVDMVDDEGAIQSLAVAHVDPSKVAVARRLRKRYPPDPNAPRGVPHVIRTGQPEMLADIDPALVEAAAVDQEHLEILRNLQLRSYMCVPLIARGRTLGAITLLAAESGRRYGEADLAFAEEVARRSALAIDNARLYQERSHVARTLQQSLLPPQLPDVPGLDLAARYIAAGEGVDVGGDFYDVFATADGDWGVVIGDVCGKGADAAALTALARYTIRAAVMRDRRPSRILSMLNEAIVTQRGDQSFVTVCYLRLRPHGEGARLTVSSGGHPLPMAIRRDGTVETVGKPGTLLGIFPDPDLSDEVVDLAPGDTVVLYTDGVTEEHEGANVFGEEGLRTLLQTCAGRSAEFVAERIEGAVAEFRPGPPLDDIALLVLRILPQT
jgi:PAS domain S-box-containing protein